MKVVILVPRRDDDGWRDRLWEFCKKIWQEEFPDWPIFEGYHTEQEGPFNRSLAINRAARMADAWSSEPWDVALVIDSDTISEPDAVRSAVQRAWETGDLSIAHHARHMLSRRATEKVLDGEDPSALKGRYAIRKTYYDSVSCAVVIRRQEWDAVGGFDVRFEGWGFEDTAFRISVETLTDSVMHVEQANCYHLWHESSPEASHYAPTFAKNHALKLRYEYAHFQPERIRAVLAGEPDPGATYGAIPKIIHRTVPAETPDAVEAWWNHFQELHPGWELKTWRDPLDPADFPLTANLHERCANGAQKAGLIRLELLATHGGVYVDSDVEAVRPLDALIHLPAFAAWEDEKVVPDAVLGAAPGHPAFRQMLNKAIALIEGGSQDAWETGPGVTTEILPGRDDVLLLPPGSFYPVHYKEKHAVGTRNKLPWVFLEHKWHHSWASQKTKTTAAATKPAPKGSPPSLEVAQVELPTDLSIAICMPWRDSGDKWRTAAYTWCTRYWAEGGLTIIEGEGKSRAAMCNDAARKAIAQDVDILIFADADTWAPIPQVASAAIAAKQSGQAVHAFTKYVKLDAARSKNGTRMDPARVRVAAFARTAKGRMNHVSGLTAVPVQLWEKLGGFDERFTGWGFEDQAFHLAAEVFGGAVQRIEGPALHWHHRNDPTKQRTLNPQDPRILLMQEYCQAAGYIPTNGRVGRLGATGFITVEAAQPNAERMQDVLSGVGGPLSPPDAVS